MSADEIPRDVLWRYLNDASYHAAVHVLGAWMAQLFPAGIREMTQRGR